MIPLVVCPIIFFVGIVIGAEFFWPAISAQEAHKAAMKIQERCEKEFAEYPREQGKKLVNGIKKCRKVAGLNREVKK